MNKRKIQFFPFAFFRVESLTKHLNKMFFCGYKVAKIKLGCILIFNSTNFNNDFQYVILTRHFYRNAKHKKWDDIEFLENRNSKFHKGNGEQMSVYVPEASIKYYIYLTRFLSKEDYVALKEYRKKRIFCANFLKLGFYLLLLSTLFLFISQLN